MTEQESQNKNLILQKVKSVQKLQNQAAYCGPEYEKLVFWDPQNTSLEAKFFVFWDPQNTFLEYKSWKPNCGPEYYRI